MSKKIILGVFVICLLAFVAVFAFAQNSSTTRWEYTAIIGNIDNANNLGRDGWELVTASEASGGKREMVFKRKLP